MKISRRQFAISAAAPVGLRALTKPNAPDHRLDIGVGTFSYHLLSLDDMIVQLKALAITQIEMSRGEFMLMNPPTPEMCRSAREKFDRAGIDCVSYYTATIKDDHDLGLAIQYAKLLGARNVSGDATGPILNRIDRRFTDAGLTFGIHNHWFKGGFPYESAEDVERVLERTSKTIGATLDLGQMAACGHDPVAAIYELAPRLLVVHLKDVAAAGAEHNVMLGTGVAKIPACMAALKQIEFKGLVAIEYEKDTDSNEDMKKLVEYARRLA